MSFDVSNIPNVPPKMPLFRPAENSSIDSSTTLKKIELYEHIPSLESASDMLENITREINSLNNPSDMKSLEKITRHLENEIELLNKFLSMDYPKDDGSLKVVTSHIVAINQSNKLVSTLTEIGQELGITALPEAHVDGYDKITTYLTAASKTLKTLTNLSTLIEKNNMLTTQKAQLEVLKTDDGLGLEKQIKLAEEQVKKLEFEVSSANVDYVFNLGLSSPSLAGAIYSAVKAIGNQTDIIGVSSGLGIATGVTSMISAGVDRGDARRKVDSHQKHTEDLNPTEMIEELGNLQTEPLYFNQMHINRILETRKNNFDARMKLEEPEFNTWMEQFITENSDDFDQLKIKAEKQGVVISDEITSVEEFKTEIAKDKSVLKKEFQVKYIDAQDTLTVTAKNLLKERLLAHEKINHNFFTFKHNSSNFMFAVTVITSLTGIALAIAVLAGVTFPPVIFIIPGIIGLAASFGMLALGIYNLHKNKPNLSSTIFHFVKANILLNKIPLLYSNWKLGRAKENQRRIQEKIEDISAQYLIDKTEEHRLTIKKHEMDKAVLSCEETYNHYFEKIQALENKILQARKDDFELTGYKSFEEKGHVTFIDGKAVEDKDLKDEFAIISDALIAGKFWKDPEANAFIKKYGGIELAKEAMLDSSNSEEDSKFVSEKLRHLILRNSSELLAWLENLEYRN